MELSASKLKTYKACRRSYWLKYVEYICPLYKTEALETGSIYHEYIAKMYAGDMQNIDDFSRENAMAGAYAKYIYPELHIIATERRYDMQIGKHTIVGIIDGITSNNELVEHKTTSIPNLDEYEYNLQWDEQILMYMLLTGQNRMHYTICRKPNIRRKQNETEEDFWHRMSRWYNEDTYNKIRHVEVERSEEEIEEFRESLIWILEEMENTKNFYRNTCHCYKWGTQCEYAPICLNYTRGQEYIGFYRKENENELKED